MPPDAKAPIQRGLTPNEAAAYLRKSPDAIRDMIRRGELGALNLASARCGRPRFVILPRHLQEFEQRHAATSAPKPQRRKKKTQGIDYYPE